MKKISLIVLLMASMVYGIGDRGRYSFAPIYKYDVASVDAPQADKLQARFVCDGTDDQVEINRAIDLLPVVGTHADSKKIGCVRLSVGQYHCSDSILVGGATTLEGVNPLSTVIFADKFIATNTNPVIGIKPDHYTAWTVIRNLGMWGNSNHQVGATNDDAVACPGQTGEILGRTGGGDGIYLPGITNVRIENVRVKYMPGNGISLSASESQVITGCYVTSCREFGIVGATEISNTFVERCSFGIRGATGQKIINCKIEECLGHAIYGPSGTGNIIVSACYITNNWGATAATNFSALPTDTPAGNGCVFTGGASDFTSKYEVYFVGGSAPCIFNGNAVTSVSAKFGIRCLAIGSTISNNVFSGAVTQSILSTAPIMSKGNTSSKADANDADRIIINQTNKSGGGLSAGQVVVRSTTAAGVTTTTTAGDDKVYGVVMATIANDAVGYIQTEGLVTTLKANGTEDIAVGDYLMAYSEAGIACKAASGKMAFAIALEAYTTDDPPGASAGVIDALLITPRQIQ